MKASLILAALATGAGVMGAGQDVTRAWGAGAHVDAGPVHVDVGAGGPAVRVRDMIGLSVYNPSQEKLGKIEDLVMDHSTGRIRYAVLSFGGVLGVGDKLFAVPWHDLKLVSKGTTAAGTEKEEYYVLNATKEWLKNAPGFDKNHWPDFASRNWSVEVDRFYMGRRARSNGAQRR
jgi:sporulation protein YlmC with PRC-barrel domain